jgi:hypothetical protein
MSYFEMKNKLQDAQSSSATGKFQILGKLNNVSKGVSIDICQGKIVKMRVGSESGHVAANLMIAMSIDKIVFMKSNNIDSLAEAGTPDTDDLLRMIADSGKGIVRDRIIQIASDTLSPVIGSSSEALIDGIAAKYPPDEDESLFFIKCKEATVEVIGQNKTDKLFDSLVRRRKNAGKGSPGSKINPSSRGGNSDDRIIEMTIEALSQILGSSSEDIVNGIAAKFPPEEDEGLFLKKCRETATNIVGANMADKIIDSLRDKKS